MNISLGNWRSQRASLLSHMVPEMEEKNYHGMKAYEKFPFPQNYRIVESLKKKENTILLDLFYCLRLFCIFLNQNFVITGKFVVPVP